MLRPTPVVEILSDHSNAGVALPCIGLRVIRSRGSGVVLWVGATTEDSHLVESASMGAFSNDALSQEHGVDQRTVVRRPVVREELVRAHVYVLVVDEDRNAVRHPSSAHKKAPPIPEDDGEQ